MFLPRAPTVTEKVWWAEGAESDVEIGGGGGGAEVGAPVCVLYEVVVVESLTTMTMITISAACRGWPFP